MDLAELTILGWLALVVAALFAGFSKTAVGGLGMVSVALFAAVLPVRQSTGSILLLFLVGDLFAITAYRHHVDWKTLLRLIPSVAVGILLGVLFLSRVGDTGLRRTIGIVLLLLVGVHLWSRRRTAERGEIRLPHSVTAAAGGLAGFTSMVANAGGGVMAIYLLGAGMDMLNFLGTGAWFFFVVNLTKLPFSIALGLVPVQALLLLVLLTPAVVVGALVGKVVITRLSARVFERLVLMFTVLAAVNLLR